MTSHAAIVSRELRIPCVVGSRSATRVLRDGEEVTVNGATGEVLEGRVELAPEAPPIVTAAGPAGMVVAASEPEPLATKLYVNLALPGQAREVAAMPVDGVGLLRAEFMLTEALGGVHPQRAAGAGASSASSWSSMIASLLQITRAFLPRPVVYRTTDFRTNEFRGLEGGDEYEPQEAQPDDRLPRLLPLHPRAGGVPARAGGAGAGARGDAQPARDDSLRAHALGAGGVPGGSSTRARWAASASCSAG